MSNLESLRKQAKSLLKQCRAGNSAALDRVHSQLSRLGPDLKLADVQHAIARERGFANWAELKQSREPLEQFLAAVRGGAIQKVREVFMEYPDLAEDSIHAACALGDSEAVALHLGENPALAVEPHSGWPPILYACASPLHKLSVRHSAGIIHCVTLLLEKGADPNTYTIAEGKTPEVRLPALYRAIVTEHMPLTLFLQRRGASPLGMTEAFQSTAAEKESLQNAYRKIFSAPDVKERFAARMAEMRELWPKLDQAPPTAWLGIVQPPPMPLESIRVLIESGVDVNKLSGGQREAPLHRMAASPANESTVKEMLAHGADPNLPRADGKTPYVLAVRAGNTAITRLFEENGAVQDSVRPVDRLLGACVRAAREDVRSVIAAYPEVVREMNPDDRSEFIKLAAGSNAKVCRTIAESGFDLRSADGGATALHIAAWAGNADTIRLLLEFHSPVNAVDVTFGSSPLTWAAHGSKHCRIADDEYAAVVKALLDAGAEWIDRCESLPDAIASPAIAALLKR